MSAIDLTQLTRSELLQLVNATELGAVLTRSRLRGHIDAGGARFLAGRRLHFVRYVRWLLDQADRPAREPVAYDESVRRQAERNRARTKASQDVGPLPDVADWPRREAALADLRTFCEVYFPLAFRWPWGRDHLRAIEVLEDVIRHGGLFAFAMFRGAGKTTLVRAASIWALLGNRCRYAVPIAATQKDAERQLLEEMKTLLLESDELAADFPEAVGPLRSMEGSSRRQQGQHCGGRLTHVRWERDRIIFPWIWREHLPPSLRDRPDDAGAQGSVIYVKGLEGHVRGRNHTRPDGTVLRPDLVLLDDPQTRQSARSSLQTDDRMRLLFGDVLNLAGHDSAIAAVCLCTKIYERDLTDRLLNPEDAPEWRRQCTALFESLPANESAWEEYWSVRCAGIEAGDPEAGNRHYARKRRVLDAGARVAWEHAYDHNREVSAIQHGMNLKLRDAEAFWAEMQNDPRTEQLRDDVLTTAQVAEKTNGRKRGTVPPAATVVTVFIDVHDALLFWVACAWEPSFTGYVIDYGTFPDQRRRWFTLRSAAETLTRRYRGRSREAAIHAGLAELVETLSNRSWPRAGGGVLRAARVNVDMGYKAEIVAAVKHAAGGSSMWLARGVGIKAGHRPMAEYRRRPGETHGWHWYAPNVRGTKDFPHIVVDVNYWKSAVHAAIARPAGERGSLSLFGRSARAHELFAEHIAGSETWVETSGRGRTVHEWTPRPGEPDNHWFDGLVGCAAAASQAGIRTEAEANAGGRSGGRKRYTQADLARRGRARA